MGVNVYVLAAKSESCLWIMNVTTEKTSHMYVCLHVSFCLCQTNMFEHKSCEDDISITQQLDFTVAEGVFVCAHSRLSLSVCDNWIITRLKQ